MRRLYRVDRGNVGLLPDLPEGVVMRQGGDADLAVVLALYRAARLGGVRTPELVRRVLTSPKRAATLYLAEQGTRRRGYIMAAEGQVVEWGGEAEVIAGLVKALFLQSDDPGVSSSDRDAGFRAVRMQSMTVVTPVRGHQVIDVFDLLGIPFALDYAGLMYLVDPLAILYAFGVNGVEVTERDGWFIVEWEGMRHPFSRNGLTKLFFGPEHPSISAPDDFPLPFWQWRMELV